MFPPTLIQNLHLVDQTFHSHLFSSFIDALSPLPNPRVNSPLHPLSLHPSPPPFIHPPHSHPPYPPDSLSLPRPTSRRINDIVNIPLVRHPHIRIDKNPFRLPEWVIRMDKTALTTLHMFQGQGIRNPPELQPHEFPFLVPRPVSTIRRGIPSLCIKSHHAIPTTLDRHSIIPFHRPQGLRGVKIGPRKRGGFST